MNFEVKCDEVASQYIGMHHANQRCQDVDVKVDTAMEALQAKSPPFDKLKSYATTSCCSC